MKELTRDAFRRWLKRQPKQRRFERCDGRSCPLGRYLGKHVTYTHVRETPYRRETEIPLPPWAQDFIAQFDESGSLLSRAGPSTALKILDKVKRRPSEGAGAAPIKDSP